MKKKSTVNMTGEWEPVGEIGEPSKWIIQQETNRLKVTVLIEERPVWFLKARLAAINL